jgi:DNA-binding CsgD family transcriptional regulator
VAAGSTKSLAKQRPTCFANENNRRKPPVLTQAEADVLALLASGKSNSQIASALSVSEPTLKEHIRSLLLKAMAKTKPHLVPVSTRE